MDPSVAELSPLARGIFIAVIVSVPVLIVILQRLPELRRIFSERNRKDRQSDENPPLFSFGGKQDIIVCPKCFRINPPDHKFCGFCGADMTPPGKKG